MYDDLIDVVYPFDLNHRRMIEYERCSQFMPFSALTGYKESIVEVSRITSEKIILDDEAKDILDNKIGIIGSSLPFQNVNIVYFVPDLNKKGGKYNSVEGTVFKIDLYNRVIYISDYKIKISDIVDICF
jgi:hypothetical protein